MNAEFEKSILLSAIIAVVLTTIFYLFQKIPMAEIESHFLSGGNEMMPIIILLVLIPVVIFLIGSAVLISWLQLGELGHY